MSSSITQLNPSLDLSKKYNTDSFAQFNSLENSHKDLPQNYPTELDNFGYKEELLKVISLFLITASSPVHYQYKIEKSTLAISRNPTIITSPPNSSTNLIINSHFLHPDFRITLMQFKIKSIMLRLLMFLILILMKKKH